MLNRYFTIHQREQLVQKNTPERVKKPNKGGSATMSLTGERVQANIRDVMPTTTQATGNLESLKLGDVPQRISVPRTKSKKAMLAIEG